jgi:D-alanine-D-alanine ligase-like ATP-grasp enzyme
MSYETAAIEELREILSLHPEEDDDVVIEQAIAAIEQLRYNALKGKPACLNPR